jgi:nucleoid-associated protein EbfC
VNEEEDFLPGGFGKLLRQAQEMQDQLTEAQAAAENEVYEAQAGGGAVAVTVDGTMQFRSVRISPEAVDPSDVGMLEDLVLAALHDAVEQVRAASFGAMGPPVGGGGLDLAGMLGGPGGLSDLLGGAGGGALSGLLGGAGGAGLTELMGPLGDVLGELMGSGELEDLEAGGFLSAGDLEDSDFLPADFGETDFEEPDYLPEDFEETGPGDPEA